MSFCETNIFIVIDDKPVGMINSFSETTTRNGGYIALHGFSSAYVPSSLTITLEASYVIMNQDLANTHSPDYDRFDVIVVDRTSKADCCGFNVTRYTDCQFTSTRSAHRFDSDEVTMESATINCGNCFSHRGITKEAWRLLNMVMPNGWSD